MTLIKTSAIALMATLGITAATAQQLPNSSFEDWKTACGSTEAFGTGTMTSSKTGEMRQRPGVEPTDWNGSNINQKVIMTKTDDTLVTKSTSDKYSGESAVQLKNVFVGVSNIGSVAPGYITFGTPWVYAVSTISACDGGTYGGVSFTNKPDAVSGYYKRTDTNTENSYIVAYLWKGTFESKVGKKGAADQTRQNVDKAIMGKITADNSGTLIATAEHSFSSTNNEWQNIVVPFDYKNDETPEMMNLVICGGDYWTRDNLVEGTTLLVDDVKFIYYSRLSSLKVDGVEVPDFAENKYNYTIDTPYSPDAVVEATAKGQSAKIQSVVYNDTEYTVTVTVSNVDTDTDGQASHAYVIHFAEPAAKGTTFDGFIKIFLGDGEPMEVLDQHVTITPTADGLCEFALMNFSLDGNPENSLGDIIVPGVKISTAELSGKTWTKYDGEAKGIELAGGDIKADAVIEAYEDENHNMVAFIHVTWIMDEENSMPIEVEFRTDNFDVLTGIDDVIDDAADATPHYYLINGTEVKAPTAPGLYIVRRGNTVTKIVK